MIFKKILKWLSLSALMMVIFFTLPAFFYRKALNPVPLPSHYKKGVYHIHSNFSDGRGTVQEITRAARELNLDFAILTDHGNPNIPSLKSTTWMNDVLLIGGSELSLNAGHLATTGYPTPDFPLPPEPQDAINDIKRAGGISFISHPFDDKIPWTDWDVRDFTGIEVFNSYSSARRAGIFRLLFFPFRYAINPRYALLKTLSYPGQNLEKWDTLNNNQKYFSIYSCDAHAVLPISRKIKLHFPSYRSIFEVFHTYVKVDNDLVKDPLQSARIIINAMRKGHFFSVVEALAPANGFENVFIGADGSIAEMGDSCQIHSGRYILRLPFDFETRVMIKRNGKPFREVRRNLKKNLEFQITEPGIYRSEIFMRRPGFSRIPWILTNPVFLAVTRERPAGSLPPVQKKLTIDRDIFSIETSPGTRAKLTTSGNGLDKWVSVFKYQLVQEPDQKDFWAALASRKPYDFSTFSGVRFQARSRYDARFWIEFRTGTGETENWYRHSFRAGPSWNTVYIPLADFFQIKGIKTEPALNRITSIIFSINNAIAYAGSRGTLFLKDFGLTGGGNH